MLEPVESSVYFTPVAAILSVTAAPLASIHSRSAIFFRSVFGAISAPSYSRPQSAGIHTILLPPLESSGLSGNRRNIDHKKVIAPAPDLARFLPHPTSGDPGMNIALLLPRQWEFQTPDRPI